MSYFDVMLESEDSVLINKVIENATYQMCIEGGEAVIKDVEDYVNLLMTDNYEPTPQFDEYMFESLSPYLEENAKYLGMFLFEGTIPEENQKIIKGTKVNSNKKMGLMQKVKNTFKKDKTTSNLGSSMMKGLNNVKIKKDLNPTKVMKGSIGKLSSVGKGIVKTTNVGNSNMIKKRTNLNKI